MLAVEMLGWAGLGMVGEPCWGLPAFSTFSLTPFLFLKHKAWGALGLPSAPSLENLLCFSLLGLDCGLCPDKAGRGLWS